MNNEEKDSKICPHCKKEYAGEGYSYLVEWPSSSQILRWSRRVFWGCNVSCAVARAMWAGY